MTKIEIGDRIKLNGNGRHTGRTRLENYACGIVENVEEERILVVFDKRLSYWVLFTEEFQIIKQKEKVIFT